jgi:4a-hydroxytetrahydrobiopterin dehydratase
MLLEAQKCVPCTAGTQPLAREESEALAKEIPQWSLKDTWIEREFRFRDFREAVGFVNRVAELAESEGHHPDIHVAYNSVRIELWTHKIGGLSRNDFILAAKLDRLA